MTPSRLAVEGRTIFVRHAITYAVTVDIVLIVKNSKDILYQ
jgi:hypothetical protein